jgi:hypothetical protein
MTVDTNTSITITPPTIPPTIAGVLDSREGNRDAEGAAMDSDGKAVVVMTANTGLWKVMRRIR